MTRPTLNDYDKVRAALTLYSQIVTAVMQKKQEEETKRNSQGSRKRKREEDSMEPDAKRAATGVSTSTSTTSSIYAALGQSRGLSSIAPFESKFVVGPDFPLQEGTTLLSSPVFDAMFRMPSKACSTVENVFVGFGSQLATLVRRQQETDGKLEQNSFETPAMGRRIPQNLSISSLRIGEKRNWFVSSMTPIAQWVEADYVALYETLNLGAKEVSSVYGISQTGDQQLEILRLAVSIYMGYQEASKRMDANTIANEINNIFAREMKNPQLEGIDEAVLAQALGLANIFVAQKLLQECKRIFHAQLSASKNACDASLIVSLAEFNRNLEELTIEPLLAKINSFLPQVPEWIGWPQFLARKPAIRELLEKMHVLATYLQVSMVPTVSQTLEQTQGSDLMDVSATSTSTSTSTATTTVGLVLSPMPGSQSAPEVSSGSAFATPGALEGGLLPKAPSLGNLDIDTLRLLTTTVTEAVTAALGAGQRVAPSYLNFLPPPPGATTSPAARTRAHEPVAAQAAPPPPPPPKVLTPEEQEKQEKAAEAANSRAKMAQELAKKIDMRNQQKQKEPLPSSLQDDRVKEPLLAFKQALLKAIAAARTEELSVKKIRLAENAVWESAMVSIVAAVKSFEKEPALCTEGAIMELFEQIVAANGSVDVRNLKNTHAFNVHRWLNAWLGENPQQEAASTTTTVDSKVPSANGEPPVNGASSAGGMSPSS